MRTPDDREENDDEESKALVRWEGRSFHAGKSTTPAVAFRLIGNRVLVVVRPNPNRSGRTILAGVDILDRVLQGVVVAVGTKVEKCGEIAVGDEVIFRRPEGELPELAFMDADIILAKWESTYG